MLDFEDARWSGLRGGYRIPYDPRAALRKLEAGDVSVWAELWTNLHHQGDVGEASYAAVPHLVRIGKQVCPDDWNLYAFVSTIDECRHEPDNPPVPEWLKRDYAAAWNEIGHMSIEAIGEAEDTTLIDALFQTIALYKKQYALARFAALSEPERKAALDELGWA